MDHIMRVDDFVRVDTIVSQVDVSHSLHWSNTRPLLCDSYTGKALAADLVGWDLFLVCLLFIMDWRKIKGKKIRCAKAGFIRILEQHCR